jgi:hypothetical protein
MDNTKIILKKKTRISLQKPWFSQEHYKMKKTRDKAYKLCKKYPTNIYFKEVFMSQKDKLCKEIQKSKKKYYSDKLDSNIQNPIKTWKIFREIIFGEENYTKPNNLRLLINDELVDDSEIVSDTLNSYFCNIVSDYSFSVNLTYSNTISSYEITNETEIMSIVDKLNLNKSAGIDSIPVKFIKNNKIN